MIKIKRIYNPYAKDDGKRVLVDRMWPRGIRKEDARCDLSRVRSNVPVCNDRNHNPQKSPQRHGIHRSHFIRAAV